VKNAAGTGCIKGCAIGDIYYSDGTCSSADNYDSTKKAVGVVFMLTSTQGGGPISETAYIHGSVVNLHDLYVQDDDLFDVSNPYSGNSAEFQWGLSLVYTSYPYAALGSVSTSGTLGYALNHAETGIYNGQSRTQKIVEKAQSEANDCIYASGNITENYEKYIGYCRAPAAEAAYAFYPPNVSSSDSKVGAGNWYLPAEGELVYLYGIAGKTGFSIASSASTGTTKTIVNDTLSVLASKMGSSYAQKLTDSYYWSSTEAVVVSGYNSSYAWKLDMTDGSRTYGDRYSINNTGESHVRAVLAF
jgi:hypothetical protein